MAMNIVLAVASLAYLECVRQRVLYGTLLFSLVLMGASVFISGLFMREIGKIMADFCLGAISLGSLLVPFFLAVNLLAKDIERRTIITILSRPVTRGQYIVGKFIGLVLILFSITVLLSVVGAVVMWISLQIYGPAYFQSLHPQALLAAVFFTFLGQVMLIAVVVLWSCLTNSSFLVTLLTIATYIIGQSLAELVRFMGAPPPGATVSPLAKTVLNFALYLFPNLAAFDVKLAAAHGLMIPANEAMYLLIYWLAYTVSILFIAVFFFKKRDLL